MEGGVRVEEESSSRRSLEKASFALEGEGQLIIEPSHQTSPSYNFSVAIVQDRSVKAQLLAVDALGASSNTKHGSFTTPIKDDACQHLPLRESCSPKNLIKLPPDQVRNCVRPPVAFFLFPFLNAARQRMVTHAVQMKKKSLACCQLCVLLADRPTLVRIN